MVKKPANHRSRKSRNPVKALANRTDIKNTYNQHDKTAILIQSNSEEDSSGKTHLFLKVRIYQKPFFLPSITHLN